MEVFGYYEIDAANLPEDTGKRKKVQEKDLCIMEMCITAYSVIRKNTIHAHGKGKGQLFPRPANSVSRLHKTAGYPHSHNADDYGNLSYLYHSKEIFEELT